MQYSPKLKTAMKEIKAVLKKHDIAAFVLLHDPKGFVEYLNHINPSYSCAFMEDGKFRVRLKEKELPGGKKQAKQLAEDTYNMITLMTDILVIHTSGYIDIQEMLEEKWGGTEGRGNHTSHTQQNN
jgi:hypothetical protein